MEVGRFPDRLQEAMGDRSARSLADRAGIGSSTLHQYLKGKSEPTRKALVAIANELGVRLEWLATGEGPKRGAYEQQINGSVGVVQVGHGSGNSIQQKIATDGSSIAADQNPEFLPPELVELIELISKYGSPAIVAEFKRKLLKIKDITEG